MTPFVLANESVRLSVPASGDVERIYAVCQDESIQRWTTLPSPYGREHARSFVSELVPQGWAAGEVLTWAVRPPGQVRAGGPEPELVGMVGLHLDAVPAPHGSAEIGFWMAASARGSGLMTRAAHLVVDYAFDPEGLCLGRVEWRAVVGNWASRRVAWKLGFRVEGQVRGLVVQRGRRCDGWIGSLLRDDARLPNEPWPASAPPR